MKLDAIKENALPVIRPSAGKNQAAIVQIVTNYAVEPELIATQ